MLLVEQVERAARIPPAVLVERAERVGARSLQAGRNTAVTAGERKGARGAEMGRPDWVRPKDCTGNREPLSVSLKAGLQLRLLVSDRLQIG